jgi:hypothetical protein
LNNEEPTAEGQAVACAILRYLNKHPDAKDTLHGIAQWWLLREWSEPRLAEIRRAVGFLLSKDLIVETRRKGLPPCYRLNQERREEIATMLSAK